MWTPFWRRTTQKMYNRKTDYQNAEEYSIEKFNGKATKNSGAGQQKGDCLFKHGNLKFRVDTKSTYTKSYSIKRTQFENMAESLHSDTINVLHFVFYDSDGVRFNVKDDHIMMKASDFMRVLEEVKKAKDEE